MHENLEHFHRLHIAAAFYKGRYLERKQAAMSFYAHSSGVWADLLCAVFWVGIFDFTRRICPHEHGVDWSGFKTVPITTISVLSSYWTVLIVDKNAKNIYYYARQDEYVCIFKRCDLLAIHTKSCSVQLFTLHRDFQERFRSHGITLYPRPGQPVIRKK